LVGCIVIGVGVGSVVDEIIEIGAIVVVVVTEFKTASVVVA